MLTLAGVANANAQSSAATTPCITRVEALQANDATDVDAVKKYRSAVTNLLVAQDFATLDCLADSNRLTRAQFAGGMWKLHVMYSGLAQPQGHATEEDWKTHFAQLERWTVAVPSSSAARIALACSYLSYAWDARGGETADTVSESRWRLFSERLEKAQAELNEAAKLPVRDPEWFVMQEEIAMGQGWELVQFAKVLRKAVKFEPDYYYNYRVMADYLLPKWHGQEGDMAKFSAATADQIGGDAGDILYFQIAVDQICHCGDDEVALKSLSWPRIQKGFAAQQRRSGPSLYNMNQLAFMAVTFNDPATSNKMFALLGDRWSEDVWHLRSYYDENKKSAAQVAPVVTQQSAR